jgi:hypothetical protein
MRIFITLRNYFVYEEQCLFSSPHNIAGDITLIYLHKRYFLNFNINSLNIEVSNIHITNSAGFDIFPYYFDN